MLGVIIGVSAVIVMVSIGEGAKARVAENIKGLGTNLLVVRPGFDKKGPVRQTSVQTLTLDDAKAIAAQVPEVAQVAPEAGQTVQVKYLAKNTSTTVLGVTEAYAPVNNFRVTLGRFVDGEDVRLSRKVAVLGATPAKDLFGAESPLGRTIKVRGMNFEIVGLLEPKGQSGYRDPDDQILIPITTAQRRLFGLTHVRAINVQVASEPAMPSVEAGIETLLRRRHRLGPEAQPDFNVRNQKEVLDTMSQVTGTFGKLLAGVAAISLFVGGIGIMNIMMVSVTERTREIGIRKAVGARRTDILFQFLVEAVVLSVLGGVIGIGLGLGAAKGMAMAGWETRVAGSSVMIAFAVAAATGAFFGLYPAQRASRLDPIDALRYD
jgi:putative ABC transport system permease protein